MNGLSRTSILVAIGRAIGAREPDEHVRNPDFLAGRLIGPEERKLLESHPLAMALDQSYEEASRNMEVLLTSRMMIPRTRFIDERLEVALRDGATQLVILGAGFDSTRSDGTTFGNLPASDRQGYWILEAVVSESRD
jgi:O-methyltransferase involved in polyketide biosynthesis